MRRRRLLPGLFLVCATLAASLAGSATSAAAPPGEWAQFTNGQIINFSQPALYRTPDGVLHVMWPEDWGDDDADILHTTILPDGTITPPTLAQENWYSLWGGGGDITPTADGGLAFFFGGLRTSTAGEPNDGLNMITSDSTGATWDVHIGNLDPPASVARSSTIGAGVDSALTPYQVWGSSVHRGLDPATPAVSFQGSAGFECCAANGEIVTDPVTGATYLAWYSSDEAPNNGVWAQEIDTTDGTPVGSPVKMPGSVTLYNGTEQSSDAGTRMPMAVRPGNEGVWVAWPVGYPSQRKLVIWRLLDPGATAVASSERDIDHPAFSAAPDGRLWVAWNAGERVFARRSNLDATAWGAIVRVPWPVGVSSAHDLKADAGEASLDVIANFDLESGPPQYFHVRLLPGLKVVADPSSIRREGRVRFTVTDAADPVEGAEVTIGGRTDTTNADGVASIRVGPYNRARRLTAIATKAGYTRGKTKVRVRV